MHRLVKNEILIHGDSSFNLISIGRGNAEAEE